MTGCLRRIFPMRLAALLSLAHCVVTLHCPFGGPRRPAALYSHPKEWLSFHASRGRGQTRMASKTPWGHIYFLLESSPSLEKQWGLAVVWSFCSLQRIMLSTDDAFFRLYGVVVGRHVSLSGKFFANWIISKLNSIGVLKQPNFWGGLRS